MYSGIRSMTVAAQKRGPATRLRPDVILGEVPFHQPFLLRGLIDHVSAGCRAMAGGSSAGTENNDARSIDRVDFVVVGPSYGRFFGRFRRINYRDG